jgi:hypothetical protein
MLPFGDFEETLRWDSVASANCGSNPAKTFLTFTMLVSYFAVRVNGP